jgi:GNAT superfamily N-acetyltransferase
MTIDAGVPEGRDPRVVVRLAVIEDAEPIARVHTAAWQAAYLGILDDAYLATLDWHERAARWLHLLGRTDGSIVLAAESDGRIVGFATGGPSRDADDSAAYEVYAIYVDPAGWRRGIGSALMTAILAISPEDAPVSLWVLEANAPALAFYARHGFEPDGTSKLVTIAEREVPEIRLRRGVDA